MTRGKWKVCLLKSGRKVSISIRNPMGGSEMSGANSSSLAGALAMLKYHQSLGGSMAGAGAVEVEYCVWDADLGDYRTTRTFRETF